MCAGLMITAAGEVGAAEAGAALFAQHCGACHSLVQEGFGPPLGGVTQVLSEERLKAWIREPMKVIESGDPRATALLQRYKVPMPPFAHLKEGEIGNIIGYIEAETAAQNLTALEIDPTTSAAAGVRWCAPVRPSGLAVELEDVVEIPRLPGRTAYKGITLLRADPREDGTLLVDELMGILYSIRGDAVDAFLDVREYFPEFRCDPGVASGLGSFALHPEFVRNGMFYTIHSERRRGSPVINPSDVPADLPPSPSPPLEWVLTEWTMNDVAARNFAGTRREVLRFATPTTAHNAQEIAFAPVERGDPDYGLLYICIGDGGAANVGRPEMAGHPRTLFGSILRIDPAGRDSRNGGYGIPSDNPFAASEDPAVHREIWAYGFRNPHRISWDLVHGKRMFAVDIGEANVEEVNLVERGGAYGWGVAQIEGRTRIDVRKDLKTVYPATEAELAGVRLPWGEYDHGDGAGVTGGYVYRGPIGALRGKYVFGDIVNGRLFFMHADEAMADRTIYELAVVRNGAETTLKALARAQRAHVRIGYDERAGDLFVLTKDDGMIRRVKAAYRWAGATEALKPR